MRSRQQGRHFGALGSSMTRPRGMPTGSPSIMPPVTVPIPGIRVNPTMSAPINQNLGMTHASGWEGLAGSQQIPGASFFDTSLNAAQIDDSTLDDIADQAISELGFSDDTSRDVSNDEADEFAGFFRVRDNEWDTLEEEELLADDDDDDEFGHWGRGRRSAHRRKPPGSARRSHHRPHRMAKTSIPGSTAFGPASSAQSHYGSSVGVEMPVSYEPAPQLPSRPEHQEGTFTSSMKMGAGLALGFFAVGIGLSILTGRK